MKRLNYLVSLSILAALILALVAVVPASADRPVHTNGNWDVYFPYTECGEDADITEHSVGKSVENYFFDRFGEDRADTWHLEAVTLTLTNNENGQTLTLHGDGNYHWDWITWYDAIVTFRGAQFIGTLPGYGVVHGTVGMQTILETCHEEGPNWVCEYIPLDLSGMVFTDQELVCNYLLNGE